MEAFFETLLHIFVGLLIVIGIVFILMIPNFIKGIVYLYRLKKRTQMDKEEIQKHIEESGDICYIDSKNTK